MVKKAAEAKPNHLLRAARKERGWTQKDVADRIGAPLSVNISRWEQGTVLPSTYYIQQLCALFGKSAKDLGLLAEELPARNDPPTDADSSSLWTVPYRRNPFFTGREEVLKQLHDRFTTSRTAALTQAQAISGLGGIGKTQIAVEYAYRSRQFYRDVFWMRAASRETLLSDFVELAHLLNLPGRDAPEQEFIVEAVKRWLVGHQRWLLILDNADDLALASEFLPAGGQGHVLLTTRAQATGTIAPSIAVEQLGQEEGILLLLRRAKLLAPAASLDAVESTTLAVAQAIVAAMDGLPLALDQAGAYIEETGCSLWEYLALFQQHRRELLSRRSSVAPEYPYSVVNTWSLAFEQVKQESPAAADLLHLCAFLYPDSIPEALLVEGAAVLDIPLQKLARDAFQRNEALEMLRKYSLVRRHPQTKVLTIHRLVQVVLRDELDEQTQHQWAERAVRVIEMVFPEVEFAHWQQCQEYLPHAQVCADLIDHYQFTFPEAAHLLRRAGSYLRERGLYAQAEPLYQRALTICEQTLGSEHPQTVVTLGYLAILYTYCGKYAQAEPLYQRALTICEQTLGSEHPQTADVLGNLALLYHAQGNYEEAEPLYRRSLALFEDIPWLTHPLQIAGNLNNLAMLYEDQGNYEEAEPLYRRSLALCEDTLGTAHPETAGPLGNLALLYYYRGKYTQAEPLYQRALALREQTLGPEHPQTAITLGNLALLYHHQGRLVEAEPLYRRSLALKEQAFGFEHPETAMNLTNLARLYTEQGYYEQAEPLHERALAIFEHILGSEHVYTAVAFGNLGHLYDRQGRYEQAESILQRALRALEDAVGPQHPRLATALFYLAQLYEHQGCYTQAKPIYQRALAIREQALGTEHPETITVQANYASLLKQLEHMTEVQKIADLD